MKLKHVEEWLFTTYKPSCLTCKFRGDVSVSYSPGHKAPRDVDGFPDNVKIDGLLCKHPSQENLEVQHDFLCDKFIAANPIFERLFSMKRIL